MTSWDRMERMEQKEPTKGRVLCQDCEFMYYDKESDTHRCAQFKFKVSVTDWYPWCSSGRARQ